MGRGRRPRGGRSLTTRVTPIRLWLTFPDVDYEVVHLLDDENARGLNDPDELEGATLCGAFGYWDDELGLHGDGDFRSGDAVCPACVKAAVELEDQSVYVDDGAGRPFRWNELNARWEVADHKGKQTSPLGRRLRRARGLAED